MKKVIPFLIFLAGISIFSYPLVSDYLNGREQIKVIETYEDTMEEYDGEQLREEWRKAREYNENLAGDPVHDPFVPGSGYALPKNYEEALNVNGDGTMGFLEIPKISVKLPIYHGTSDEVLKKGVGHMEVTALPIGGSRTHSVLTGHRGLPSAELFTRLDELGEGDCFYIHVLDETFAYEIDQIKTVTPDQVGDLIAYEGEDLCTLVTCTPYGVNTHRLLVRGRRTEYIEEQKQPQETVIERVSNMRYQYVGMGIGFLILVVLFALSRLTKRWSKKKDGQEGQPIDNDRR